MGICIGNKKVCWTINGVRLKTTKPNFTNLVPFSINSDGSIYNGTGYKNGYRVRSGGAEVAATNTTITGFIPVKGGDIVYIYGWDRYVKNSTAENAINIYDSSFNNLGQVSNYYYGVFETVYPEYRDITIVDRPEAFSKYVLPPGNDIAYIRVSAYDLVNGAPASKLVVTINEALFPDPFVTAEDNWTANSSSANMIVNNTGVTITKANATNEMVYYAECNHIFRRKEGTYTFSFTTNGQNTNNYGACVVRCFDAKGKILTDVSAYTPNHSRSYNTAYQGFIMGTGYPSFTFTLSEDVSTFQLLFTPSSNIAVGGTARFSSFNLLEP